MLQGAKKIIFTACYSGKLKLIFTSPNIISTSPKNVLMSRLISKFFSNLNSSKNFTCPSAESITEFTTPIAKSTGPGLSDTTFFAHWCFVKQCGHENYGLDHPRWICLIFYQLLTTPSVGKWIGAMNENSNFDLGV